jgi:hypothetical protein
LRQFEIHQSFSFLCDLESRDGILVKSLKYKEKRQSRLTAIFQL